MPKKILNRMIKVLPHIVIILSIMFITFWILDIYNPMMNFLNSKISNWLLLIFFICSLILSMLTIALDRSRSKGSEK